MLKISDESRKNSLGDSSRAVFDDKFEIWLLMNNEDRFMVLNALPNETRHNILCWLREPDSVKFGNLRTVLFKALSM
ncbi:hypothetical protein D3C71_2048020 [compost metagenome]